MGLPRSNLIKKAASPQSSRAANSFEAATTFPQLSPFKLAPASPSPSPAVNVGLDCTPPQPLGVVGDDATLDESLPRPPLASVDDAAPSAAALLERAALLGPPRLTWESIVVQDDPILDEKMKPHVAERREQLRKIVKATLGACLALCVAALAASAIAGGSDRAKSSVADTKSAPASASVTIEKLDGDKRGRATTTRYAAANASVKATPANKSKRR